MSKPNDQSRNTWGEEDENETPRSFRDSYLNAINPGRSSSRANDLPEEEALPPVRRPRSGNSPSSGRGDERAAPQRSPRSTRPTRDESEERPRQQSVRSQSEAAAQQSSRRQPAPRRETVDNYADEQPRAPRRVPANSSERVAKRRDERYDEYIETPERRRHNPDTHHRKRRRGGRAISNILIGCLGGLITLLVVAGVIFFFIVHNTPLGQTLGGSKPVYNSKAGSQALTLGSATQVIVKNQLGNVTINVVPGNTAKLDNVKKVQADNQSGADALFQQFTITVKPISPAEDPTCLASNCLLIATTVPATTSNNGLLGNGNGNQIDLTLTLPDSFNPSDPDIPNTITASTTPGNITVNGFKGILNLSGASGASTIHVTHALIYPGSCLQTTTGDVNIDTQSSFDTGAPSTIVPCSNQTSTDTHFWYSVQSGKGNVNLTLTAGLTNLKLDASLNNGKMSNDFNLSMPTDSYQGPLDPTGNPTPTASLRLFTSTGNIAIHKQ